MGEIAPTAAHPSRQLRLAPEPEDRRPDDFDAADRIGELETTLLRVAFLCREQPAVVGLVADAFFRGPHR